MSLSISTSAICRGRNIGLMAKRPRTEIADITALAKQGGGSGKDLVVLDPILSKNKGLRARKRSPDALNIFPDTYDLPLHPPKRLGRYATIFTDWCNGLVAKCHVDISKWPPQKHPFWRYLIQKSRTCLMFVPIKDFWDVLWPYYCFWRLPWMSETCWMPRNVTGTL